MLYGNLTRDPEVRALPSGQQVTNFSVATNRTYKDKDGAKKEQVEYHNVVAFGKQAELIGQYFTKGRPIFVEGRIQTRSWEKDGAKQYRTEVVVEQFQFGSDGGASGSPRRETPKGDVANSELESMFDEEINPEDIPF